MQANITYDQHGTPGVWARSRAEAWYGVGWLHGRHRPLQSLLLGAAGRGQLAGHLLPRAELVGIDTLVHRLDIPHAAARESRLLSAQATPLVDAYLVGFAEGLRYGGQPFELRLLGARLPPLDRTALIGGLLTASVLGLAQCQERMELALVELLGAGADATLLERMFHPHLDGWCPQAITAVAHERVPSLLDRASASASASASARTTPAGGSNAWAVAGERTASGAAMLCGDPHLQINQLPALFFELRVHLDDERDDGGRDAWLGATIPGLPAFAVGRTRRIAWSGTFSVADNVDLTIETLRAGRALRPGGAAAAVALGTRRVEVRRRGRSPLCVRFRFTDRGTLLDAAGAGNELSGGDGGAAAATRDDGVWLASRWAGGDGAAEALQAYMELPTARSAQHAQTILSRAHTLSLHFVLADRDGDIRHCQAGRVPRRQAGWSGLYPLPATATATASDPWLGIWRGDELPRGASVQGCVVSANEGRLAADGRALATMAQPAYRGQRITDALLARRDHDVTSMQRLQLDVYSLQAERLRLALLAALPNASCRLAREVRRWDGYYRADSVGAHAFDLVYRAARDGLCARLGGDAARALLRHTELGVWWCEAFDRLLGDPAIWERADTGGPMRAAVAAVAEHEARPWGEVQRFTLRHMMFGGLPRWLGLDRGPLPLPGSVATVSQGNVIEIDRAAIAVGPAYRMVCDLSDDGLYSSLPGGIDGSRFATSYDCWLADWQQGRYHRVGPPQHSERALPGIGRARVAPGHGGVPVVDLP